MLTPPVDLTSIMTALEGDKETLKELVNEFISLYPADLKTIKECIEQEDPKGLREAAHSLKGAVGNFGAEPVRILAYELEKRGKDEQLTEAMEIFNQLTQEMQRFKDFFSQSGWEDTL